MPTDPFIVQVDDTEHSATAAETARIDAIRAGQQDNIPGLAE